MLLQSKTLALPGKARSNVAAAAASTVPARPRVFTSLTTNNACATAVSRSAVLTHPSEGRSPVGCYAAAVADKPVLDTLANRQDRSEDPTKQLKVVIAGAGIAGLTLALALLKKGIKVLVLERDLTAIRGEGKYRGPIQVQSNALAALEAIDPEVAEEILSHGCITGDRINGLCDGVTGDWYIKFDTFHPAVERGMPVTRVISRFTLQEILAKAVIKYGGEETIQNGCHVVAYEESINPETGKPQTTAILEDGTRFGGDVLIGTDGIWSKIRTQMIGETQPSYSQYTCYTGISNYVPADIDVVGYRVFLGNGQYFVSSDVGGGKMQWYAFHKEPAGGTDAPGTKKQRLLKLFGHWNYNAVDLIKATPEEDVLRRDIYDRAPMFKWAEGNVALLGDSAHAMQPNLGQGGCMAIEDAFQLACDLGDTVEESERTGQPIRLEQSLKSYQNQRVLRVSAIHGMAGMAAFMASTYKAYLGEGLGPLSWIQDFKILHPGRVIGGFILKYTMPMVLDWVLGGNVDKILRSRAPSCRIGDKPRAFSANEFTAFMENDEALAERTNADWLLVTERACSSSAASSSSSSHWVPMEYKGVYLADHGVDVGCRADGSRCQLLVDGSNVLDKHASIVHEGGRYHLQDLSSVSGTWVNGRRVQSGIKVQLHPGDAIEFGAHPAQEVYRVKLQHVSYREATEELCGESYKQLMAGAMA